MGKKLKTGKNRRDKFYRLAVETGYRSRSAFKLIQLNRRFQFLQKARVLIDLCAAPGGWLQVASKFMPVSSVIIGVDLVPIKPIPNVITLQQDITTEKCRQVLRKELQNWKVDVVLNDGAPNVGANWIYDAFSQAHLTLMAFQLASEFLRRGGTFITKVFRSQDYQALLWVFKQLFRKVQASKPQASRSESAEIFVVCQSYLAPDKIDRKFFDPKFTFKQVEEPAKSVRDLVTSKKPKVEGYTEGDYTLYHRFTLMDFIKTQNAVDFLDKVSEIKFDNSPLENHPETTAEIRECCKDIRVLGRKELRSLLNWRNKLRKYLAKELREHAEDVDLKLGPSDECGDDGGRVEGDDEQGEAEQLEEQLASLKADQLTELKRKKRKILKDRRKQRERDELNMDLPGVSIAEDQDITLFSLKPISSSKLREFEAVGMQSVDETAMGTDLLCRNDAGSDTSSMAGDLHGHDDQEMGARRKRGWSRAGAEAEVDSAAIHEVENPLLVHLESREDRRERQTDLWFANDVFAGIDTEVDEGLEIQHTNHLCLDQTGGERESERESERERSDPVKVLEEGKEETLSGEKDDSDDETSSDESEIKDMKKPDSQKIKNTSQVCDDFEIVPVRKCVRILDEEGLALGTSIATSKKRRRDIVDDSFNRYAFDDGEGRLPDWFVDNEQKYRRRPLPFDPAMAAEFRQRWKEINARPIKKIAEAKARKKRRFLKKMEQVKRKAEAVVNTVDASEHEKMVQMRSIYKKAGLGREKREVTYVVSKRGGSSGGVRRPPGVKGKYKVVDSRMKKDLCRKAGKGGKEGRGKQRGNRK